jgi:hypothetical protein
MSLSVRESCVDRAQRRAGPHFALFAIFRLLKSEQFKALRSRQRLHCNATGRRAPDARGAIEKCNGGKSLSIVGEESE